MAVAYTVPGSVRSIRSFDRRAGWTFIHAGSELALLGADLEPLGSWRLPAGVVGLADADPITDTVVFDDGSGIALQRHGRPAGVASTRRGDRNKVAVRGSATGMPGPRVRRTTAVRASWSA